MTVADLARNVAEQNALHAKKDAVRQTQSGDWKLTLTIAAGDLPTSVMTAAPGTRYVVALVEVGDDEEPVYGGGVRPVGPSTAQAVASERSDAAAPAINAHPSKAEKRRWSEMPRSARAAMLCEDERFQQWHANRCGSDVWSDVRLITPKKRAEWAAAMTRTECHVLTRSEFDTDPDAGDRWDRLEARYMEETGLIARDR